MSQTKVKLVSSGVITVDNLHANHGITTDHIGEGSVLYYTDARVQSYLTSNNYIKTTDVASLETLTSISLSANTLSYVDEAGNTTNLDLSLYLDDTNLARLVSGTLDGTTGIATFTRDDASTFTVDFSAFLSDANDYVTSAAFNTSDGVLTLTRLGGGTVTVDLDNRYLTSFTETDPIYTASSWYTTTNNASNWDTAYGWGNHASAGYLTSFTETDPIFTASAASGITSTNITNWNTAYGWGNHASAGYQPASTAITTSNIGSQSVNYATSAGNADTLDGQHGSYYDHRAYTASNNYLGGYYVSGGTEKPNSSVFGAGKLKIAMLSGSNLGYGGDWNDVLWMSTYTGSDVKPSWAIVGDKYSDNMYISRQTYDSASWSTGHKLWHSGNDGSGSGLDADLLDGIDSSSFFRDNQDRRLKVLRFTGEGGDSGNSSNLAYAIYQEGGAWTWPYPDLRIAMHTGIKFGANPDYYGMRFYTDYDMSSQVMSINNGHDPLGGGNVYVNNSLQAGSSLRAPIFYDSNDTGYYIDPNSTTNIRYLKVNTTGTGSGTRALTIKSDGQGEISFGAYPGSWSSALQIQNNNNTDFIWISPIDDGYSARFRTGGSGLDFYTDGGNDTGTHSAFIGSGYIQGISSSRAPIFYDSNDTGYYVDPNGTSKLSNLQVDDGNIELYKSQTIDMSGAEYSTSNYYPVMIGLPTSGVWIQIQNNLNSNVPSWSTHPAGFTLNLRWWTNGSGWGTTEVNRRVTQYHERFTNLRICGGITQMGTSSQEVVYLRGGGVYYFKYSRNISGFASSTNYSNPYGVESAGVTSSPINDVWNSAGGLQQVWVNYVRATTDLQTPVLYDYNNTGYYFDGSATGDSIRVAGDIVAYYSDERLKDKKGNIKNAIEKVKKLNGFYYTPNKEAQKLGYKEKEQVGVSAQEVEAVLPQIIKDAPIGNGYKTLDYSKLTPLLIEAIKEQQKQIEELKQLINK